jgi:phage-related protein
MPDLTYLEPMPPSDKPLVWMSGEIRTPPFSAPARIEAGVPLRRLQQGELLGLPHSRPMPDIGRHCHELRIRDEARNWRIFYHVAADAIVILDVHPKSTRATPPATIGLCQRRLARYQSIP